jgi:glycosyltransferase involved in cell wall biosynthesis
MSAIMVGRIAITSHRLGQGGTDRVAMLLANGFTAAGFPADLVIFARGGRGEAALTALAAPGVRLIFLRDRPGARLQDLRRGLLPWIRYLRRERPRAILSNGNNMNWATTLGHLLACSSAPLFLKLTNPILRPKDKPLKRRYRRLVYARVFARASAVLPLSPAEARDVAAMFPAAEPKLRPVVNPYVTDAMLAAGQARPSARPSPTPSLIVVGRLQAQKRLGLLLEALAQPELAHCRLTILGEGPERPALERRIAELGLAGRVAMPGFRPDIPAWLAQADLFVLSSAYEGLPAVLIEALACGCPIVTTNCFPAAHDLVDPVPGCEVVDEATPQALAAAIASALTHPRGPAALLAAARAYRLEPAIRSHLAAMRLA